MLICNQVNEQCDPECPHGEKHEAKHEFIWDNGREYVVYCDEQEMMCGYRDDEPMVRCVEVE